MLSLTKKTEYALMALVYLSKQTHREGRKHYQKNRIRVLDTAGPSSLGQESGTAGRSGVKTPVATSAREIAAHFGIPLPVLMNVLKELAKGKIVRSERGAGGGYVLAVPADKVSVLDVLTVMEGPMRLAQCVQSLPVVGQECPMACACDIQPAVRGLHHRLSEFLRQTSLADMLEYGRAAVAESGLHHLSVKNGMEQVPMNGNASAAGETQSVGLTVQTVSDLNSPENMTVQLGGMGK